MPSKIFADVILPLALPRSYTYSVPEEFEGMVASGKRVVVQFGKKKLYSAIVHVVHDRAPEKYQTKDILQVIDDEPLVVTSQIRFWEWMAEYYMCTLGEVMKAALPSALKMESETFICKGENIDIAFSDNEEMLLNHLKDDKKISIQDLLSALDLPNPMGVIKSLLDKQAISINESIESIYKPKTETYIALHQSIRTEEDVNKLFENLNRAQAQQKLLMAFLSLTTSKQSVFSTKILKKLLIEKAQVSTAVLNAMIQKEIFQEDYQQVSRLDDAKSQTQGEYELSPNQLKALEEIKENFETKQVTLLHGITSSGKTELYIRLIAEEIAKGKQVLYLLPEIALTSQIINRLRRIFGSRVGVYHSKFSDSQRVEIYKGVLSDEAKPGQPTFDIILGVRSSLFLPFKRLGLIIVDEEHENTYKQYNPAPRYNARDSAIMLASMHGAKVLLGTATPSIESYYNAQSGKYGLVDLNERYLGMQLPAVKVVNTIEARKRKKMKSHFSEDLLFEIEQVLAKGEQAILFQNRRGFAPFIECNECAWVPKCEYCDVSLTLHKVNNQLICHYCGYAIQSPSNCLACGSPALQTKGFGTEKVEEELAIFFPQAKIERMDLDSTRSKFSYDRIISEFESGKIDILIGTQMVTKGLDFDKVSLVGILNADNMLNFPDFRAYERSYQLMSQVSGRAGRKNHQGLVLIQTAQPKHPIIEMVVNTDYMGMYATQLNERKAFKYPPIYRLISISLKHKNQPTLKKAAEQLALGLKEKLGNNVLGPESPPINRIQGMYIMNILIKVERETSVSRIKGMLNYFINYLKQKQEFRALVVSPDVDPM
ncbi:MAG: primosomal protein N' [Bacteroidales bacterium]|nr:primosomal protein N' [Bacteroidales bacterium]